MKKFITVFLLCVFIFIFIVSLAFGAGEPDENEAARAAQKKFTARIIGAVADFFKNFFLKFSEVFGAAFASDDDRLIATISQNFDEDGGDTINNTIQGNANLSILEKSPKKSVKKEAAPSNKKKSSESIKQAERLKDKNNGGESDKNILKGGEVKNNAEQGVEGVNVFYGSGSDDYSECSFAVGGSLKRNRVIINEVAWTGGEESASDEWIELKNLTGTAVDISDWQILDKGEDIKIIFEKPTIIQPKSFLLLERTDDDSTTDAQADVIYKGALANRDEGLRLFSKNCELEDEVLAEPTWPAGDEKTKMTMERGVDLTWHTSGLQGGTPRKNNTQIASAPVLEIQSAVAVPEPVPSPVSSPPEPAPILAPTPTPIPEPATIPEMEQGIKIIISEIMYDLPGGDADREWIEVKNLGAVVDLTKLKFFENDTNHNIAISRGDSFLPTNGYAVIVDKPDNFLNDYPDYNGPIFDSSFSLSNTGEVLSLTSGGNVIDSISYSKTSGGVGDGKSLQLFNGELKAAAPTPGKENILP